MWLQQTPKMSQGELLAYIFRARGGREERENGAEKKEKESEEDGGHCIWMCVHSVCVLVSVLSKHLHLGLLIEKLLMYSQFSLKSLSGVDMRMNEGEDDERREGY